MNSFRFKIIIASVFLLSFVKGQVASSFDNYVNKYINGCDNEEGLEWIGFCKVDTRKFRELYLKSIGKKDLVVFFQNYVRIDTNHCVIEYRVWKKNSEYFLYILYDNNGKILDYLNVRVKNKKDFTTRITSFNRKDYYLRIYSFDPVNEEKLGKKFVPSEDCKNIRVKIYHIYSNRFKLIEKKAEMTIY